MHVGVCAWSERNGEGAEPQDLLDSPQTWPRLSFPCSPRPRWALFVGATLGVDKRQSLPVCRFHCKVTVSSVKPFSHLLLQPQFSICKMGLITTDLLSGM